MDPVCWLSNIFTKLKTPLTMTVNQNATHEGACQEMRQVSIFRGTFSCTPVVMTVSHEVWTLYSNTTLHWFVHCGAVWNDPDLLDNFTFRGWV